MALSLQWLCELNIHPLPLSLRGGEGVNPKEGGRSPHDESQTIPHLSLPPLRACPPEEWGTATASPASGEKPVRRFFEGRGGEGGLLPAQPSESPPRVPVGRSQYISHRCIRFRQVAPASLRPSPQPVDPRHPPRCPAAAPAAAAPNHCFCRGPTVVRKHVRISSSLEFSFEIHSSIYF